MAYLRSFILELYPNDINHINNTVVISKSKDEKEIVEIDYDNLYQSRWFTFNNETRCIASLYSRLLPKFKTDNIQRIIIECVEDKLKTTDIRQVDKYIHVQVEFDSYKYFSVSKHERKKMILNVLQRGIYLMANENNWDKQIFQDTYQKIIDLDYQNTYIYKRKRSPNRQYICSIICKHEISYFDIYLEIKNIKEDKVIRKERLVRKDPHELIYSMYLGNLYWKANHKVIYTDEFCKNVWTFLVHGSTVLTHKEDTVR
ncbi:hypothetical protein CLPU_9c00790 [Gottschalkia purinilytica]|uniref:Uncharacterized protein n=1 Tax=Gottschalkia purinilytica TaxID=1503 RepID=A0A0L0W9F0_GOTPU|nr:hypothetical protein [Gottschalkia purinilytica]KNF08183.1 hypothetical protein CLPU_9c00790 [Gottschalkia purinilytica]